MALQRVLACLLFSLLSSGSSRADADAKRSSPELLYPYDSEFLLLALNRTADVLEIPLIFRLPFFGFAFHYVFVHTDGHLLFNKGLLHHDRPYKFPALRVRDPKREEDPSLIAPWFSPQDVPRNIPGAGVYAQVVDLRAEEDDRLKQRLRRDFRDGMVGSGDFDPRYALIVTWDSMIYGKHRKPVRVSKDLNTYQAVVATDETRTYVMFNYAVIKWVSGFESSADGYSVPPFVGFNAGNGTRAFEFRPYSQNGRVAHLPTLGFGNGLRGRFFFRVDEEVSPGSCTESFLGVNMSRRPRLNLSPRHGSEAGGTVVNVTGPCFTNRKSAIRCRFGDREVDGVYININRVSCVSPSSTRRGFVDLSVSVDNGPYLFHGMFYVRPEGAGDVDPNLQPSDRVDHAVAEDGRFAIAGVYDRVFDVRGKFAQQPSKNRTAGRRLVSVSARFNASTVVEFRARPAAARWQYRMYVLVDGEYVYFKDVDSQVMIFKGVTLYQPMNVFNMSRIAAKFDSGAAVEVLSEGSDLGVQIYLPRVLRKGRRDADY